MSLDSSSFTVALTTSGRVGAGGSAGVVAIGSFETDLGKSNDTRYASLGKGHAEQESQVLGYWQPESSKAPCRDHPPSRR
ncbi:hypothetical protein RIF29_33566 [Crotalaria pallida]|uniref:Uncharacterized protein n=1 Tax=Crotalaria pallida TaxID=3830 RepID=A0AAN9EDS7_CROPI